MNYFEEISNLLLQYKHLGEQFLEDGTLLIGKVPEVALNAWLHEIYPPLNHAELLKLENDLERVVPNSYKYYLTSFSNGLNIFNDTLSFYGLRKMEGRSMVKVWQPYSLYTINILERVTNSKDSFFYIGGYGWDGSLLYIDELTNRVHHCTKDSSKSLNSWDNFETMVVKEVKRLVGIYEKIGVKILDEKTTP